MLKKITSLILLGPICLLAEGQQVNGKLKLETGQTVQVQMEMKTTISQQAMGQAIDFGVDANVEHGYRVTNSNDESNTLSHKIDRIRFSFDGMGQKRSFDSQVEKDMKGPFGETMKEVLAKKYDMIIDSTGNTLMSIPEKIQLGAGDSRMMMISNMMKDVFDLVQPPQKGKPSFFKVLPSEPVGLGDGWTESGTTDGGKFEAAYSISAITDSSIVLQYAATSTSVTVAEIMGSQTTTTMKNQSKGTITVDRQRGLIREKDIETLSTGTAEGPFGNLPVTSKTTMRIRVK